ncbi:MAG: cytochrome b N-terminal domain-containing protein [Dissulfuribacterales bacterium]
MYKMGTFTTAALFWAILSGVVVAYQYEVFNPFVSTVGMNTLIPFGEFFRSLHYWSAQFFFLGILWHTFERLSDAAIYHGRFVRWGLLVGTVPMAVLALFTGYVLKWDATGRAAGHIAENLLLSVPVLGVQLNRFLVAVSEDGLMRVYAAHIGLSLGLWWLGTWFHTKRVIFTHKDAVVVLLLCSVLSIVIQAPLEQSSLEPHIIKGPWFFLGVQELLKHIPPFWAGIIFPSMPVLCLLLLPVAHLRRLCLAIMAFWCLLYSLATLLIYFV